MFKTDLSFNQNGTYITPKRERGEERLALSAEVVVVCGCGLWVVNSNAYDVDLLRFLRMVQ